MKWNCSPVSPELVGQLCSELLIEPVLAEMLIRRGIESPEAAWLFLDPSLDQLHDPGLLKGMKEAVSRIEEARKNQEKVIIYGDYDADGITSVAVLKRALEILGIQPDYYIPRRLEDGYGLKREALQKIAEEGYSLVITVDCGIRAADCVRFARELGLDLIVTDHHLPEEETPSALAVINPKQEGCPYPFKDLAGVGVVFKLVQALFAKKGKEELVPHFLKLVAIGTVADMVPLIGENRIITHYGLEGMSDLRNPGLRALLNGSGIGQEVRSQDISFRIAPRLNAYTRMGGGSEIVELFFQNDPQMVACMVEEMNDRNSRRKAEEVVIMREIEEQIEKGLISLEDHFLVFHGKDWHKGVIGNVASRMVSRFYRPCLVLSEGESSCQGSGRSISGFHLLKALASCEDLLSRYGGHAQAVGCSLSDADPSRIEELRFRLNDYTEKTLAEEEKVPTLEIEAYIPVERVDVELYTQIKRLEPFGKANSEPVFASRNVMITEPPKVLSGRHLKMRTMAGGRPVDMIWWQQNSLPGGLRAGNRIDVAYSLKEDTYRNGNDIYLNIRDLRIF